MSIAGIPLVPLPGFAPTHLLGAGGAGRPPQNTSHGSHNSGRPPKSFHNSGHGRKRSHNTGHHDTPSPGPLEAGVAFLDRFVRGLFEMAPTQIQTAIRDLVGKRSALRRLVTIDRQKGFTVRVALEKLRELTGAILAAQRVLALLG